jgi:hypothetical protein
MSTLRHRPTFAALSAATLVLAAAGATGVGSAVVAGDLAWMLRELPFALVGAVPLFLVLRTRVSLRQQGIRIVNPFRSVELRAEEVAAVHVGAVGGGTWTLVVEPRDGAPVRLWALTARGPAPETVAGEGPPAMVEHAVRIRSHLALPRQPGSDLPGPHPC